MDSIPVFYDERQNATVKNTASPSASKPAHVVASWLEKGLPIELRSFDPVTVEQLKAVHDAEYVDGILSCQIKNGFYNTSAEVARALPWTSGSLLAAARYVAVNGGASCSPTSGFHHASAARASGYCTFNGLMVATKALLDEGLVRKVGILDLDMHHGDGTEAIMLSARLLDRVEHYTFGLSAVEFGGAHNPEASKPWLQTLPEVVRSFRTKGCDILLYQAGADPHEDDPLGGSLSSEQMRQRDMIVFQICAELCLPVAWNLAGGYQKDLRKVIDLHDATMQECVRAFLRI